MTVNLEDYRQRIKDAFNVPDLFDYMEISMDDFLDAFPEKWEDNTELQDALDVMDDEDEWFDYDDRESGLYEEFDEDE